MTLPSARTWQENQKLSVSALNCFEKTDVDIAVHKIEEYLLLLWNFDKNHVTKQASLLIHATCDRGDGVLLTTGALTGRRTPLVYLFSFSPLSHQQSGHNVVKLDNRRSQIWYRKRRHFINTPQGNSCQVRKKKHPGLFCQDCNILNDKHGLSSLFVFTVYSIKAGDTVQKKKQPWEWVSYNRERRVAPSMLGWNRQNNRFYYF